MKKVSNYKIRLSIFCSSTNSSLLKKIPAALQLYLALGAVMSTWQVGTTGGMEMGAGRSHLSLPTTLKQHFEEFSIRADLNRIPTEKEKTQYPVSV